MKDRLKALTCRHFEGPREIVEDQLQESSVSEAVPIQRQALHAWKLEVNHPLTGTRLHFEAPVPDDMQNLITLLRQNKERNRKRAT